MPLCIFLAIAFFWFIKFISVVFHMWGHLFVAKLVGWVFATKTDIMSLQLEVSKGIEVSLQARFLRIRRIASTSFWQAFPMILVWSRVKTCCKWMQIQTALQATWNKGFISLLSWLMIVSIW